MNPNPDQTNLRKWKSGESGNPKGRPPRLVSSVTSELKAQGYERVTKAQIAEAMETILNLSEDKVREIVNDKNSPMFLRVVARQLASGKGFEAIQVLLDRAHGKPTQQVDANVKVEAPVFTGIDLSTKDD